MEGVGIFPYIINRGGWNNQWKGGQWGGGWENKKNRKGIVFNSTLN